MTRHWLLLIPLALTVAAPSSGSASAGWLRPVECSGSARLGCAPAVGLAGTTAVAVDPRGANVYAVSVAGAVLGFKRDSTSGALTPLTGPGGCLHDVSKPLGPCASAAALVGASELAVSPDGANLYVASARGSSIAELARDARTGDLHEIGCVSDSSSPVASCASADGLVAVARTVVSPDGRSLYAVSPTGSAISIFSRNPASGLLAQQGCISDAAAAGAVPCTPAVALGGASDVTVSPDGRNVYVAAPGTHDLATFSRDATSGRLSEVGCIGGDVSTPGDARCDPGLGLTSPTVVSVSPDGRTVYAASPSRSEVGIASRDPATGDLIQNLDRRDGSCLADWTTGPSTCLGLFGLNGVNAIAFAPSGTAVYFGSSASGAVSVASVDLETNELAPLGTCFASADPDCLPSHVLGGAADLAVTSDGRHVYVAATMAGAIVTLGVQAEINLLQPSAVRARVGVRRGRAVIGVRCPQAGGSGCVGTLALVVYALGHPRATTKPQPYDLLPGARTAIGVRLSRTMLAALHRGQILDVRVAIVAHEPSGGSSAHDWRISLSS